MDFFRQLFFTFTKSERVSFLSAATGVLLSGLILVGLGLAKSTEAVPASGGEYAEGVLGQPTYVNPVLASSEIDKSLVRLIFSKTSDVAEKIEASEDGRIWRVRLKEGLMWQDGEKLTSDDIVFTIQKTQDPETSSPMLQIWQGIAARRLSEIELQVSLVNPYAFFSNTLKNLYILPKHLFAEVPPANWRLSDYNLKPIGSGPYKFLSYEKRPDGFINTYKLSAWEDYSGDKSLIQNLYFRFFASAEEIIKSFNSGQIDAIPRVELQGLEKIERPYETFPFHLPSYYAAFINQSKSISLKDPVVRMAMDMAIDKKNLVEEALGGHGRLATGPIPEETGYFNNELSMATTSLELASSTLEDNGWKIGDDGFREKTIKRTKIPLEINVTSPNIDFLVKTAEFLQREWQKIGFKVNLTILPPEEITANIIKNRDYEILVFGNVLSRNPDLFSFWHSSERFYPGLNLSMYNDKKADSLIETIRQNLDEESRKEQFNELQSLIASDYPAIFLYSPDYVYVASKDLRGLEPGLISEPADRFVGANKWHLKTTRALK